MALTRQFLISPALARLIRKEQGTQARVREGYFSSTPERTHFVRLDPPHCCLVMMMPGRDGQPQEEATEVPLSQAQALLDVAPGKIAYERTTLTFAPGVEAVLEKVLVSRPFDLLSLSFASQPEAERFQPPLWVGPEVSEDPSFSKAAIALQGEPEVVAPEITNTSLEALLDLLQSRLGSRRAGALPTWSPSAPRGYQPSPVDEQLLTGLAQGLSSAGQGEGTDHQGDERTSPAPQHVRRASG